MTSSEVESERAKSRFLQGFGSIVLDLAEKNYAKIPEILTALSRSIKFLANLRRTTYGELTGPDITELQGNIKEIRLKATGMPNDAIGSYLKDFLKTRKAMQDIFE